MNEFAIGESAIYDPPVRVDASFEPHRGQVVVLEKRKPGMWYARFPTPTPDGDALWLNENRFKKIEEVDDL